MKIAKVVLASAFVFGSIAAASAQGGGGGGGAGGGGGDSPAAKSGQGASSSSRSANPGATLNDTKERGGSGMRTSGRSHKHRKHTTM
ncbi:hypothetical protein [Bradyrhizobium sp. CCBAU 53421]|uniref:hypothetical protein n=1 Tax=Bradyrhizobium sp. CCBAU 53421 TaxID=1325120 RepID=UPI00188C9541|nr:hypothetical protein [Bradyrhizobium sp. CCBAU 53421]QOZ32838.1 hypothetical protein XH92_15040 [Bradyrhizobium sp. CCBAU 53421]